MEAKQLIWGGMMVGSLVGSFLPLLWGASELSMSAMVWGAVGGILGIYVGYKISQ